MKNRTRNIVLAGLFAALTAVGALIRIPLGAMSLTLQFFFTAMAGVLLGGKWGAVSQAVYVLLGLAGVPIFTRGGGISYLLQPSFGFLLGLIPAAAVIGAIARADNSRRRTVLACAVGLLVLYAVGLPYMGIILNVYMGRGLSFWRILRDGMLVYLPGDCLKIAVTALLAPILRRALP